MTDRPKKRKWSAEAKQRLKEKYDNMDSIIKEDKAISIATRNTGLFVSKSTEERYIAKRTFDYLEDQRVEAGEILTLRGSPNDKKLISLGFFTLWEQDSSWENECIKCGKKFGHTSGYTNHCASHYQTCAICNKGVPDERFVEHQQAHQELLAI